MPLYLDEGERIAVPPPGRRVYFIDADSSLKEVKSDGTKSTVIGGSGWYDRQEARTKLAVSALTQYERLKLGDLGAGTSLSLQATLTDATLEGGWLSCAASASGTKLQTASIYQHMQTGKWGFTFRGKVTAPAGGQQAYVGLSNGAGNGFVWIGTDNATSATKFVLKLVGGATTSVISTVNADTAAHDFGATFDGTTVTLWIDGVNVGTTTTTTNLLEQPMFLMLLGFGGGIASASRISYGVVDT